MGLKDFFIKNMELNIECRGATSVALEELNELQGNLKDLTEDNYVKLRNSMTEHGFSFPIFYWQDTEGKKWIIDAHQRHRTLKKMKEEGWNIPLLPADPIFAKDKAQAKKKLLLLNSRYGQLTQEGWDEFTSDLDLSDIDDMLEIPEMDFNYENNEGTNKELDPQELAKDLNMKCPKCGFKFQGKEGIETLENESAA